MEWQKAPDIVSQLRQTVKRLQLNYIDCRKIICFRSFGSSSSARARIWSFPRIWQQALNQSPHYIIEVLSPRFDKLPLDDKRRVLIHELLHIPKNFSGSLLPHRSRGRTIHAQVEKLFQQLRNCK